MFKDFLKTNFKSFSSHLNLWQQVARDHSILEMMRNRLVVAAAVFGMIFLTIGIRLVDVMLLRPLWQGSRNESLKNIEEQTKSRGLVVDRNGEILATHLVTASLYANPKIVMNPEEAALKLSNLIPELSYDQILKKLNSKKGFVWIARHIPPKLQQEVNHLGIPGIYLQKDTKRIYPFGPLVSHVVGYCGIDNDGLAGVEKYFDAALKQGTQNIQLSIDIRVQHVLRDELSKAIEHFEAIGGCAMVLHVPTGEVIGMTSLPDFNPNRPGDDPVKSTFNRNTLGVYEPGSTFKVFNSAIALETGKAHLHSRFDATHTLKIGRFEIHDFRPKNRVMDLSEIFLYSSNIGSARIALDFGGETQRSYLEKFGLFNTPKLEIPELGAPLIPSANNWGEATTMTVAFGHGVAIAPLQVLVSLTAIINDGILRDATLIKHQEGADVSSGNQIISKKTSYMIRNLMRLVALYGSGRKANVPGLRLFGKTGTALKVSGKGYSKVDRNNFFIGGFPKDNPKYMIYVSLDNPKATKETYGFATSGWNTAPTTKKILERIAPILNVIPDITKDKDGDVEKLVPISYQE